MTDAGKWHNNAAGKTGTSTESQNLTQQALNVGIGARYGRNEGPFIVQRLVLTNFSSQSPHSNSEPVIKALGRHRLHHLP